MARTTGWWIAVAAGCLLAGCSGEGGTQMSQENRDAMTDEMLQSDSLSSGYIPPAGSAVGNP